MSVKKLQLTLAERQIIALLIGEPRDGKVEAARNVRYIRGKLGLRHTTRSLERVNKQLKEFDLPELNWDDLLDPSDLIERVGELLSASQTNDERTELVSLLDKIQPIGKSDEFTLDEAYVALLRDLVVGKDWLKPQKVQRDGRTEEIVPTVPPALLEAFANVADAVNEALSNHE